MNYKVDESTLIAYLYGELSAEEQAKVNQYLEENPEAQATLEELGKVRTVMAKLEDEEPLAPIVMNMHPEPTIMRKLVPWLSAAAAVCLFVLVGYATDLNLKYQQGQVILGFGEPATTEVETSPLTQEQLVPLLEGILGQQNAQYNAELKNVQSALESQIAANQQKIAQTTAKPAPGLDEGVLQAYLMRYQEENVNQMASLLENSTEVQREELQIFLAEYHQFLEERRLQDLQLIEAGFQAMQDNVNQQKSETEEILANIITSVNSTNY